MTVPPSGVDVSDEWRRLSPWSIADFVVRGVASHTQAMIFAVPAGLGIARTGYSEHLWQIVSAVAGVVVVWAVLSYMFTRYRVTTAAVEQQRGALFRRRVNLPFDRIQNVNIVHPFYFRPLGLVSLRVDSAGSTKDEIHISALPRAEAEALREFLSAMRRASSGNDGAIYAAAAGPAQGTSGEAFFSRSLADLVVHGLTNNRAFIAVAGVAGLFWQSGLSLADIVNFLGIDFDLVIAGTSIVRLAVLSVIAFVLSLGILALLSVLVSIVSYYGFTIERSVGRLTVRRGLFTRHEVQLKKSRVQLLALKQDWLDCLLRRRNVYLEQITHQRPGTEDAARQKIMVPSVRVGETPIVTNEIWPLPDVEAVLFTPISKRYFRKHAAIRSVVFLILVVLPLWLSQAPSYLAPLALVLLPALIGHAYLEWRRAGVAVVGGTVFVRSGAIGVDYRIFPAHKLQDIGFVQTPFMRRRSVGSLVLRTAAATVRVPYLPAAFAAQLVDHCAYEVEATPRPWM